MAIQNINLLQQQIDFEHLKNVNDRYILDSLANLGQRLGVKGAGITMNTLYLKDLINFSDDERALVIHYNSNIIEAWKCTYDGILNIQSQYRYNNAKSVTGIKSLNVVDNIIQELDIDKYSTYNTFAFKGNVINDLFEWKNYNDIRTYISNISNVSLKNNIIEAALFGETFINDDIIYEKIKYNITNSIIETYYKVQLLYVENNVSYYLLCVLNLYNATSYQLKMYVFTYSNIEFLNKESLNNVAQSSINEDTNINSINVNVSNQYDNIINDIISIHKNNLTERTDDNGYIITLHNVFEDNILIDYNKEKNVLLSINNQYQRQVINNILTHVDINIETFINFLNNHIAYLIPNIIKYCIKYLYTHSRKTLLSRILCNLYEYINNNELNINTYNNLVYTNQGHNGYLVIDRDFEFKYLCSDDNIFNMYMSTTFNVELCSMNNIPVENQLSTLTYIYNNAQIIKDTKTINVCSYGHYYNYDGIDTLSYILFNSYVNPYIGYDNNWFINNKRTGVSAAATRLTNVNFLIFATDNQSMHILESNIAKNFNKIYSSFDSSNANGVPESVSIKWIYPSDTSAIKIRSIVVSDKLYNLSFDETNKSETFVNTFVDAKLPYIYLQSNTDLSNTLVILRHTLNTGMAASNPYDLYILYNLNTEVEDNYYLEPVTIGDNKLLTISSIFNDNIVKNEDMVKRIISDMQLSFKLFGLHNINASNDNDSYITLLYAGRYKKIDNNSNNATKQVNDLIIVNNNNSNVSMDDLVDDLTNSKLWFGNEDPTEILASRQLDSDISTYNTENNDETGQSITSTENLSDSKIIQLYEYINNNLPSLYLTNMLYSEAKFMNKLGILTYGPNGDKYFDYLGANRANGHSDELIFEPLSFLNDYTLNINAQDEFKKVHEKLRLKYEVIYEKIPYRLIDTIQDKDSIIENYVYQENLNGVIKFYNTTNDILNANCLFVSSYNYDSDNNQYTFNFYLNLPFLIKKYFNINSIATFVEKNKIIINGIDYITKNINTINKNHYYIINDNTNFNVENIKLYNIGQAIYKQDSSGNSNEYSYYKDNNTGKIHFITPAPAQLNISGVEEYINDNINNQNNQNNRSLNDLQFTSSNIQLTIYKIVTNNEQTSYNIYINNI